MSVMYWPDCCCAILAHQSNPRPMPDIPLRQQLADCLAALVAVASPATVSAYTRDLEALAQFAERQDIDDASQLDAALLRRFLGAERSRGLAPRSLARRRAAISHFATFLVSAGILSHNPAELEIGRASRRGREATP